MFIRSCARSGECCVRAVCVVDHVTPSVELEKVAPYFDHVIKPFSMFGDFQRVG